MGDPNATAYQNPTNAAPPTVFVLQKPVRGDIFRANFGYEFMVPSYVRDHLYHMVVTQPI